MQVSPLPHSIWSMLRMSFTGRSLCGYVRTIKRPTADVRNGKCQAIKGLQPSAYSTWRLRLVDACCLQCRFPTGFSTSAQFTCFLQSDDCPAIPVSRNTSSTRGTFGPRFEGYSRSGSHRSSRAGHSLVLRLNAPPRSPDSSPDPHINTPALHSGPRGIIYNASHASLVSQGP